MKITTDVDTSRTLIAHGLSNNAVLYWVYTARGAYDAMLTAAELSGSSYHWVYNQHKPVAAFTATELGERIPGHVPLPYRNPGRGGWFDPTTHRSYDHEVDARAACLLHIIDVGIVADDNHS